MKKTLIAVMTLSAMFISTAEANNINNTMQIGDFYEGGVIYWLDAEQGNNHGLIADINDRPDNVTNGDKTHKWYAGLWNGTTHASYSAVYTGKKNTQIIIDSIGHDKAEAANACVSSSSQGYTDWYLPSKDEQKYMFIAKDIITKSGSEHGGDAFENREYWSSTEESSLSPEWLAWATNFTNGTQESIQKGRYLRVRCIRSF